MITASDAWRLLYIVLLGGFVLGMFTAFEWLPDAIKRHKLWRNSRKK